jgi:hypothetical protein
MIDWKGISRPVVPKNTPVADYIGFSCRRMQAHFEKKGGKISAYLIEKSGPLEAEY